MSVKVRDDGLETLYDHYIATLTHLGMSECGLSREAAQHLAHSVLMASLAHMDRVPDLRVWLTGAMVSAAHSERNSPDVRKG
jgi:hypothetical protein